MKPTPTERRELLRAELHELWPSLPFGTTKGGISLDPSINPLTARLAVVEARVARLKKIVAKPVAKAGDIIEVHVPPIGVWRCDAVVDDPTGRPYLKLSRRTGGATEFRFLAPAGFEILQPQLEDE